MKNKYFHLIVGLLFAIIFILHSLRLFYGWEAEIGGFIVPIWWSWIFMAIAGSLSYMSLKLSLKS